MKKIISLLLAVSMMLSLFIPAFATEREETVHNAAECTNIPVIIVRGMDFGGLYVDCGTENEAPAINTDVGMIISGALKAIGSGILKLSLDAVIDGVIELASEICQWIKTVIRFIMSVFPNIPKVLIIMKIFAPVKALNTVW